MTLLVLPLVEPVPELDARGVGGLVADNSGAFLAFGVSFLVIYRFWAAHDRLFASCPTSEVRGRPAIESAGRATPSGRPVDYGSVHGMFRRVLAGPRRRSLRSALARAAAR